MLHCLCGTRQKIVEVAITASNRELINMAPNGNVTQGQKIYNNSIFVAAQSAPTLLLSYHEVLFLKAEALFRLNRRGDAKAALKDAIIAAVANIEESIKAAVASSYWNITGLGDALTTADVNAYFDTEVSPRFEANPLKEIMIQKYLGLWGANGETVETYNDVRRLKGEGLDVYELQNPKEFPLRLPYATTETSSNPAVYALYGNGQYVYTENVWWAGGTR